MPFLAENGDFYFFLTYSTVILVPFFCLHLLTRTQRAHWCKKTHVCHIQGKFYNVCHPILGKNRRLKNKIKYLMAILDPFFCLNMFTRIQQTHLAKKTHVCHIQEKFYNVCHANFDVFCHFWRGVKNEKFFFGLKMFVQAVYIDLCKKTHVCHIQGRIYNVCRYISNKSYIVITFT